MRRRRARGITSRFRIATHSALRLNLPSTRLTWGCALMLKADRPYRFVVILAWAVAMALLGGCGGGGGGEPPAAAPLQGVFVDSPVQGLGYAATPSGLTGRTDARGQFDYRAGDRVSFQLFGRPIGSEVPATPVVTVLSVFGASSVSDPRVVNLTRPRIIDIDILFFNKEIITTKNLIIPHPQLQNRNFVLIPLNQLSPNLKHPVLNKTIHQLLRICPDKLTVNKI